MNPREKTIRNNEIFNKYRTMGIPVRELSIEYRVTPGRIYQILNHVELRVRRNHPFQNQ